MYVTRRSLARTIWVKRFALKSLTRAIQSAAKHISLYDSLTPWLLRNATGLDRGSLLSGRDDVTDRFSPVQSGSGWSGGA